MKDDSLFRFVGNKILIRLRHRACETTDELLSSDLFQDLLERFVASLVRRSAPVLRVFDKVTDQICAKDTEQMTQALQVLAKMKLDTLPKLVEGGSRFVRHATLLHDFVEQLYNFWREFERFLICDSTGDSLDQRPYRTFNDTVEKLTHLVRQVYRDIQENITGQHPNIFRQVHAGAEVAVIALPKELRLPKGAYQKLLSVPVIRQILMYPPLSLNPPMNKRTGAFERIDRNPLDVTEVNPVEWLCYPAKVGPLLVLVYVHESFLEMGLALCNLFELADDDFLQRPADAVFLFGVPGGTLDDLAPLPTVFYDDEANNILAAACPNDDQFGYFGYLKKMMLTLHNIKIMKMDKMPYHGAMVRVVLKGDRAFTMLLVGDTGAGKSETLEAFRAMGGDQIEELTIIADDMGSLDIDAAGRVIGYGTETGAFVRLDDLNPGYAFGQLDRAIFLNTGQVNARVVLPVTTYEHVTKGYPVDLVLYANNYEEIDAEHPVIERLAAVNDALRVFREGTAMSKGTTTSTGLVHTYFVNVFGATQYRTIHDKIATRFFEQLFAKDVFVGQLRTRLGIGGFEHEGPEAAAKALLEMFGEGKR